MIFKPLNNRQKFQQVICILFLNIIYIFGISGCTPLNSYQYVVTNRKQPQPIPDEVSEDKLPNVLPGKLSTSQQLISEFKKIGTIGMKTEFETSEQADQRLKRFETDPIFSRKFYVSAFMKYDNFYSIKYDPYSKRFSYKILCYLFNIDKAWITREEDTFSIIVASKITGSSKYTGANAFGVTKQVDKTNFSDIGINFVNRYAIPLDSSAEIHGQSIQVEPNNAQILKPNLALVFEFTPAVHYVDKDRYGVLGKSYSRHSPTIDSPNDYITDSIVLFAKLKAIYLIDKKNLKVYGMINI